jgi:hypothetical protein
MIKQNELEKYITSADYWGNPIAINALCEILGLNVIIIENKNDMMRIPYIYDGNKATSKYLFLYHEYNHYELITFDYIFNSKPVTKVIFKNNYLTPPFYIIFLIFASNYIKIIDANNKNNYKLLPNFMRALFEIYNKIELKTKTKTKNKESVQFMKLFGRYFLQPQPIEGGALSPYQYRMNNSYQNKNRPQYTPRFIKNNSFTNFDTNPQSNISYYITIDMELQKGTSLSPKDLSNLKCRQRWNSVRKSYSDLRGLKYAPAPDYTIMPTQYTKNKSKTQKRGLDFKKRNNISQKRNY